MRYTLSPAIKESLNNVKAQNRVGKNARCACGENRAQALILKLPGSVICACCDRIARGMNPMDKHHIAGRVNHWAVIMVPVNDHLAYFTVKQLCCWPQKTSWNPDGSPLLTVAACIRGLVDFVFWPVVKDVAMFNKYRATAEDLIRVAEILEAKDEYLTERRGRHYWLDLPISKYAPNIRKQFR
jgi:hypothetical protein